MVTAYIGLGSNLGDRMHNLSVAVDALAHLPETHVETISHAYETEPAYVTDQPNFYNAVVELTTSLEADVFLQKLLSIEDTMGRVREVENGPRVIDFDLLLYGDEEWNTPDLVLPHPGIRKRDFVLVPLLELAPRTKLPDGTLLQRSTAEVGDVLRDLGEIPDFGLTHNQPIDADEWVEVSESDPADRVSGFDAALQFRAEALEQEGIPYAYDPFEPGAGMNPFGTQVDIKLMVPAEYAPQAKALIAGLDNASADSSDAAGVDE